MSAASRSPLADCYAQLPAPYKLRDYPTSPQQDSQTRAVWGHRPTRWTLGREHQPGVPWHFAYIHNWFSPYTDGFHLILGRVHDDREQDIWSAASGTPRPTVTTLLAITPRLLWPVRRQDSAADLALEKTGAAREDNGAVEARFAVEKLRSRCPDLEDNWRWQMCDVRGLTTHMTPPPAQRNQTRTKCPTPSCAGHHSVRPGMSRRLRS